MMRVMTDIMRVTQLRGLEQSKATGMFSLYIPDTFYTGVKTILDRSSVHT